MSRSKATLRQCLATMTVGFNEFGAGLGLGWMAPTLHSLQNTDSMIPITAEQYSWIASIDNIGRIIGSLLSATLLDIIGRKPLLILVAFILFLMWLLILCTESVFMIFVMRILSGIASGTESGTNSVYIGENSSPFIRGIFGTVILTLFYLGILLEFVIATYLSYRETAIVNSFITFVLFLATFWLREPVQFLLMKGRENRAFENFLWLSGHSNPDEAKNEFEKIKLNVQKENTKKSSLKVLTSPVNYKTMIIMLVLYILFALTGYMNIMSYASTAFSSSQLLSPNEFTILFGALQLIVSIGSSFVIDHFNRRSLIILAFSLVAFIHACTALLYYVHDNISPLAYFPWLIFFSISTYSVVFSFAYPAIFLLRGELFPLSIRAVGTCVTMIGFSATNFVTIKIFALIYANYGICYNFAIFSSASCALVIFVYLVLPETKNKTLIEIQEILEKWN